MIIKSFSKINFSLRVLKKLKSGLHNIQSLFYLIDLHDKITIRKNHKAKDEIVFIGRFKKGLKKKNNSVSKTLNILRDKKRINNYYKITINKKVPLFSGLGGGTSNAYFVVNYFIKNSLDKKLINIFASKIGSDFRLFLNNRGAYQKDLKSFVNYKKKFKFYILLVYPNINCSSKEIYSKVKQFDKINNLDLNKTFRKREFINLLKKERNDLQSIAVKKFPVLKKIIDLILIQKGCYFSRMTGSGSVCFGVFKTQKNAKYGLREIKRKFPNYWCVITKTI